MFKRYATLHRTVLSESIRTSMHQYDVTGSERKPRPSSGVDKASQPPDSPNRSTALELCLQRPDNAYTAFDLSLEDRTVGERNDNTRYRVWEGH